MQLTVDLIWIEFGEFGVLGDSELHFFHYNTVHADLPCARVRA
jgi:hypothetical protein